MLNCEKVSLFESQKQLLNLSLVDRISSFILSGCKSKHQLKVGVEFEHFVVTEGFQAVSFDGPLGIESLLKNMATRGWQLFWENQVVIGAQKDGAVVSLEPGGQLELSLPPLYDISKIHRRYQDFLKDVLGFLNQNGQQLVCCGYQPKSTVDEIQWVPKKRYDLMSKYLGETGIYAHNMMKSTGALQLSLDFVSETDCVEKYVLANRLAPIISALFDSTFAFEGKISNFHCLRAHIWRNTDAKRCFAVSDAFNSQFSVDDYARYIVNMVPIVQSDAAGNLEGYLDTVGALLGNLDFSDDMLEHVMTMCFPPVRLKRFIELRMCDALPFPYNLSYIAMIKGIFYSVSAMKKSQALLGGIGFEQLQQANLDIISNGLGATYAGRPLNELAESLVAFAEQGLPQTERCYLNPIKSVLNKRVTLGDQIKSGLLAGNIDALAPLIVQLDE